MRRVSLSRIPVETKGIYGYQRAQRRFPGVVNRTIAFLVMRAGAVSFLAPTPIGSASLAPYIDVHACYRLHDACLRVEHGISISSAPCLFTLAYEVEPQSLGGPLTTGFHYQSRSV